MGWLMCTRAGAGLQQICAKKHSLKHSRLVWRSSLPGAQRCCFRMSPQKIGKQLGGNLPLAAYDGAELRRQNFPNIELCSAVTVTLKACLHSRSGEVEHTLA